MIVLALDTCLTACSAAVLADGRPLASRSEAMARGHQERLAGLVREVMDEAGVSFAALDRIGVTVGPGSFTGLRVGLAFAKGLALALDRPCIGVGALEALAASVDQPAFRAAVIDAGRGHVYLQVFEGETPLMAPDSLPTAAAAARLAELYPSGPAVLVGPGAPLLAGAIPTAALSPLAAPDPLAVARLALHRPAAPPRPLYLRAPDAKPKAA
jgi:tRNA threonylcarbamoyladenosine biosynthesis protein TsaB